MLTHTYLNIYIYNSGYSGNVGYANPKKFSECWIQHPAHTPLQNAKGNKSNGIGISWIINIVNITCAPSAHTLRLRPQNVEAINGHINVLQWYICASMCVCVCVFVCGDLSAGKHCARFMGCFALRLLIFPLKQTFRYTTMHSECAYLQISAFAYMLVCVRVCVSLLMCFCIDIVAMRTFLVDFLLLCCFAYFKARIQCT